MRLAMKISLVAFLFLLTSSRVAIDAQQRPEDANDPPYFSQATAVLVDVVVRDRQGKPVLTLKADDFEIFEDGVPQALGSFTVVSRGAGIGIGVRLKRPEESTAVIAPTGPPTAKPATDPAVMALVFDALSPDGLNLSQRAALEQVRMSGDTHARIAVFATEPSIRVLQRYTTDPTLIRAAVRRLSATGTEAKAFRDEHVEKLRERLRQMDTLTSSTTSAISSAPGALGAAGGVAGQLDMERRLVISELNMHRAFDALDRDHRGYGTTNALMAVLESMSFMPGRKSIVFFSEGLPASPALQHHLQSVIERANRSNITIYAVDAGGLRVLSSTDETYKEVKATSEERLRQLAISEDPSGGPMTRMLERAEDLMRYDSQGGLSRLADDTGGFLIRDTNNLGTAFTRIDEDMRFHYLLSYSPRNDVLDGKFRTIGVKVKQPGLAVFARKGYRAVRTHSGLPVLSYEAPVLAMLDRGPLPNAFPSQAAAFAFPEPDRSGLTPVIVRVNTDALQFNLDQKNGAYSGQAAVVVRIRNEAGEIVQKLSQQYLLNGDAKDLEGAKKGEILFYREPELQPGVYQLEAIVFDANAEKGSARVSTVTVPGPDTTHLRMSSLVLVSRTEQTAGPEGSDKTEKRPPFYYGNTLLYPNVGEPIRRRGDDSLSFYFVVYPAPDRCACSAQISLLRNGKALAEATRPLEAQGQTRLQHVGHLPIADLPSGTYELRVTVSDGKDEETRAAFFTVT